MPNLLKRQTRDDPPENRAYVTNLKAYMKSEES